MPDYSKTVIYVIKCKDDTKTDIYVGSTCNFKQRVRQHKNASKYRNLRLYDYINENGGWDNFTIEIYDTYPCENVKQCRIKEREVYETLKAGLNVKYPQRTRKEWYEANKDVLLNKQKLYNNEPEVRQHRQMKQKLYRDDPNNKEKLAQQKKNYYTENKEHIRDYKKEYFLKNKERIMEMRKKQYEDNKETMLEYYREYYRQHKEEIRIKQKENKTEEQKEQARIRARAHHQKNKENGIKRVLTEEQKEKARIRARAYHLKKKSMPN
jgi:hypothetical protein